MQGRLRLQCTCVGCVVQGRCAVDVDYVLWQGGEGDGRCVVQGRLRLQCTCVGCCERGQGVALPLWDVLFTWLFFKTIMQAIRIIFYTNIPAVVACCWLTRMVDMEARWKIRRNSEWDKPAIRISGKPIVSARWRSSCSVMPPELNPT